MKRHRMKRGFSQKKDRLVKIGMIGIDSGQVLVADPAYIKTGKGTQVPSYPELTRVSLGGSNQLKNKRGVNTAVVSSTGLGDGEYPVYAVKGRIAGMPEFGERVKRLIINFDTLKERRVAKAVAKRDLGE